MEIVACGAERAEDVYRLTRAAFREYTWLDPPSGALRETLERVRDALAAGGGAIAVDRVEPVDPARWGDWWPGLLRAEPSVRRALAPGALWQVEGRSQTSLFRRGPQLSGTLVVLDIAPQRRLVFQLSEARIDVELGLEPDEDGKAAATLIVDAPRFSGVGRAFPSLALARLASLVRAAE